MKPHIILSGVNFVEGGPLAVFADALQTLSESFMDRYTVTALVHRAKLFDVPGVNFLEFPQVKGSWLRRLYFEYIQCRALSRSLSPYLWLSMHDITPNTVAAVRAVYCHNPAPFYQMPWSEALTDRTFTLFRFLYRFLYRINIAKNDFVIVQQEWLRKEFRERYPVQSVVVAHPSIPTLATKGVLSDSPPKAAAFVFLYPALARSFKNFELLLKATQSLEDRGVSGFQVQITIDGTENGYAASLRIKFASLKSVQWLGQQTRACVEGLYQEANCLIFPSRLETWGMPISEWKRTMKPMLVADLPYAHETVGDYQDVLFIDVHNVEALAEMMKKMIIGSASLSGSRSKNIAAPFAADWHELFAILLEGRMARQPQNAESGSRIDMLPLSASIVLYKSDPADLARLFEALQNSDLEEWIVVDNGATEDIQLASRLEACVHSFGGRYIAAPRNLGFGAGHNLALAAQPAPSDFHVMLNPDILFEPGVFATLVKELSARPEVGLIMPKVLYSDGTFQPVCKLLPTPADFALRRFAPVAVRTLFRKRLEQYELEGIENIECDRVPFLSGCFLFARRLVLNEVGGFDDRFFLYLEDVDLCRRMAQRSKLLYWPHASIVHICYRGAYRSTKLMILFLRSAVAYFNKWGWLFDAKRRRANSNALGCILPSQKSRK